MQHWKIILIALLLVLPAGCKGPAEEAGEELDSRVDDIRKETKEIKEQIGDYKQQIDQARSDLETSRQELEESKAELEQLRQTRDEIITEMKKLEQDPGQQGGEMESPHSPETP
ncbi:MAG: hypothetical protein SCH71_06920 [Desulfobulbaceae bacterium]|nr:hypothetical protein [Desulfobulbaceae bacterium]